MALHTYSLREGIGKMDDRIDFEEIKEILTPAHWAVIELIGVIEKIVK